MSLNLLTIQASEHAIKSVTISKSAKAEVVRTFALDLKKGQNKVDIKGLPSGIETARPSGLGVARLDDFVFTVDHTKPRSASGAVDVASTPDSVSSETIRLLSVKLASLEKERYVREQESQLLLQYANTLKGEHVTPSDMIAFLGKYVEHTTQDIYTVTEINEKIVATKRQIEDEQTKATQKVGEAHGKVMALINTDADTSITFTLTYIVRNCIWIPKYELHTVTENGKPSTAVTLHYLSTISQSTGEDWTDAALTLSTTTTNLNSSGIRTPAPLKIRVTDPNAPSGLQSTSLFGSKASVFAGRGRGAFANAVPHIQQQQQLQQQQQQPQLHMNQSNFGSANAVPPQQQRFGAAPNQLFGSTAVQPPAIEPQSHSGSLFGGTTQAFGIQQPVPSSQLGSEPYELVSDSSVDEYVPPTHQSGGTSGEATPTEPSSVVQETPLSMYFSVAGKPSIPSDGLKHRVTLAVLPFESKMSYITIPREDPTVFLQCEVKNTSEYRLITGPMDIIVDGSYITATSIRNDINVGDAFECFLGNDISTKVTYVRTCKIVRPESSAFAEGTVIATYTTKISIQNKHQYDIADLIVRDRMPTSSDPRIRVILRKPLELGDTKQGQFVSLKGDGVKGESLKVGWEKLDNAKGGEKEGKFEWRWSVKSGATVDLLAEYDVKGPKDIGWDIQPQVLFGGQQ